MYIVMQDLDQMCRSQDVFPVLPLLWSIVEGPVFEACCRLQGPSGVNVAGDFHDYIYIWKIGDFMVV